MKCAARMMKLSLALGATLFSAALGSVLLGACGAESEGDPTSTATDRSEEVGQAEVAHDEVASPAIGDVADAPYRGPLMADGLLPGMKRWRGEDSPIRTAPAVCANPKLTYYDGPIVQSPVIVPVFWNSNVNAEVQANLPQFFSDVTQSTYWSWLWEYNSLGLAGGTNQVIVPGSATAGYVLTPSRCNASTTGTCKVSDAQLQAELLPRSWEARSRRRWSTARATSRPSTWSRSLRTCRSAGPAASGPPACSSARTTTRGPTRPPASRSSTAS